jgi:hypothetical protein
MAEKELSGFDGRAGPGCRLHATSFDLWLREAVSITEMIVCVVKWWKAIQVQ